MSYNLVIQSEAIIDIQEAFEWYEEQNSGLGFDFIEEVENGYDKICNHPKYYIAINTHFRRLKINRFPYLIVYEIQKDSVIIIAVKHAGRNVRY